MLLTRCPHCQTTFRITAEALSKADGQVRCGRCANVFNAYAALSEKEGELPESSAVVPGDTDLGAIEHVEISSEAPEAGWKADVQPDTDSDQERDGGLEQGPGYASDSAETADETPPVVTAPVWLASDETSEPRVRLWAMAAAGALAVLLAQATHHFRNDLAVNPLLGAPLQSVYAKLGEPIVPRWDVEQYEILDWVATAEPTSNGQGNLIIEARIHNRGQDAQPYPHVQLELKDRWEAAIGSRIFAPREYLGTDPRSLMQPGSTTQANLIVVDPGPDAYGFELDVCIASGAEQLVCSTDEVYE